jgi:uncharacterized protein YecT (DUF1311 family)
MARQPLKRWLYATLIAAAALHAQAQSADPCLTQNNTLEINACAKQVLQTKDKEPNDAYQKLLKSFAPIDKSDDTDYATVKKQLTEGQRAWIHFRDNDCKAKYSMHAGGTIRNAVYLGCLAERTEQRTRELRIWLK